MTNLGLRARLTIFVTVVFAVTMIVTSILARSVVEDRMLANSKANAEAVLSEFLESIYGGVATLGVVDPESTSRFFYRDSDGSEISEQEYFDTIAASFDSEFLEILGFESNGLPASFVLEGPLPGDSGVIVGGGLMEGIDAEGTDVGGTAAVGPLNVAPDSGAIIIPEAGTVTFAVGPVPTGDPYPVDLGADVVAVAQTLTFSDGATLEIGVSNPLQPVSDGLSAITNLMLVAVPTLVAIVAFITWQAATRALSPVNAIASEAAAITASNINQRVPVPGANDEVRHLAVTVNNMLDRLQHAQDRQRQLVSDASHELRSPVAASRAQLEVAAADPGGADWEATAKAVLTEQRYLTEMIDDLLTMSRLDESGVDGVEDIDFDDLVATEVGRQAVPVDMTIGVPIRLTGNHRLLTRAIRNLLDNATRHAVDLVAVTVVTDGEVAVMQVDDDGPGVPANQRETIFERFRRVDDARDRGSGGTGLGLAIAREVAVAHHGDLGCTASPLGGARFTLTLPISRNTA